MRINEITESAESINSYLLLMGIDISNFESQSKNIQNQNSNQKYNEIAKSFLIRENSQILALVNDNDLWDRFSDDPEVSLVYDRLVKLYNSNLDYIETLL